MNKDDLVSIDVHSGVNEKGEGFCMIVAIGGDKQILIGQMSPEEVRKIARDYLEVAEAAETDGIMFKLLQKHFNMNFEEIVMFIALMRSAREEHNAE